MPNVRKEHARFQFTEFNYWEHILSLLPKDDHEFREEVASMVNKSITFTQLDQPAPDGEFTVTDRGGKEIKINGDQLIEGSTASSMYLPTDDPEYQDFFESKLDLLDRLEEKYSGKGHEVLKEEIGLLRCKNQNLAEGIGYEYSPGNTIISGDNGIQKIQDVLLDLEKAEKTIRTTD